MLYYDEIFVSIQGESRDTGKPCIFVRLYGCPFRCSYCDQPQEKGKRISVERLVGKVFSLYKETKVREVCITGGEPLVQEEILPLVYELMDNDFRVSIETSGLIKIDRTPYIKSYRYIMDVKCPSSGMSGKNVYDNLLHLQRNDDVVFVISDRKDYEFMKRILKTYPTNAAVLVSPMFDKSGKPVIGSDLVKWILEDKLDKVRVQVQIHKMLDVR